MSTTKSKGKKQDSKPAAASSTSSVPLSAVPQTLTARFVGERRVVKQQKEIWSTVEYACTHACLVTLSGGGETIKFESLPKDVDRSDKWLKKNDAEMWKLQTALNKAATRGLTGTTTIETPSDSTAQLIQKEILRLFSSPSLLAALTTTTNAPIAISSLAAAAAAPLAAAAAAIITPNPTDVDMTAALTTDVSPPVKQSEQSSKKKIKDVPAGKGSKRKKPAAPVDPIVEQEEVDISEEEEQPQKKARRMKSVAPLPAATPIISKPQPKTEKGKKARANKPKEKKKILPTAPIISITDEMESAAAATSLVAVAQSGQDVAPDATTVTILPSALAAAVVPASIQERVAVEVAMNAAVLDSSLSCDTRTKAATAAPSIVDSANELYLVGRSHFDGTGADGVVNKVEAAKRFEQAALLDHIDSCLALSKQYDLGDGVPKDEPTAIRLLQQAARLGSAEASYQWGRRLLYAIGFDIYNPRSKILKPDSVDVVEGIAQLKRAAEQDHEEAQRSIITVAGYSYHGTSGFVVDKPLAAKLFKILVDLQSDDWTPRAQFMLGCMLRAGDGVAMDKVEALKLFEQSIGDSPYRVQQHADTHYYIATMVQTGEGVIEDIVKAAKHYELAVALNGHKLATCKLARILEMGEGAPMNKCKALELYQSLTNLLDNITDVTSLTSEYGDSARMIVGDALFHFAGLLDQADGIAVEGVPQDRNRASKLYEQTATGLLKHAGAQYQFGLLLESGRHVRIKKDPIKAVAIFDVAAEQGHHLAQSKMAAFDLAGKRDILNALASLFLNGKGVFRNKRKAIKLYTQAADMGLAAAQFNLACCYFTGRGVQVDPKKGVELLKLAATQQYPHALERLSTCYSRGEGVPLDTGDCNVTRLYTQAAALGLASAQFNLGSYDGVAVSKELDRLATCYTSSEENVPQIIAAKFHLACCYLQVRGKMPATVQKGIKLLEWCVAQGSSDAMDRLSSCYIMGEGVPKNHKEAAKLIQQACAAKGVAAAAAASNSEGVDALAIASIRSAANPAFVVDATTIRGPVFILRHD